MYRATSSKFCIRPIFRSRGDFVQISAFLAIAIIIIIISRDPRA